MPSYHVKLPAALALALCVAACAGDQTAQTPETATETTAEAPAAQEPAKKEAPPPAAPTATAQAKPETKTAVSQTKPPAPKPRPTTVNVTLPESTMVKVALVDSIDTDTHRKGDRFRARLLEPLGADGRICFAAGAQVMGVLDTVVESGRLKTPAELGFRIVSIADAGGQAVPVRTYQIYQKKGSKTGRDVAIIGGGAVVGGVIGKITGKKGGTEIGAVAGAAAGAGAAAATGKDDIVHSAGTEVTFFLSEPLSMSVPN